MIGKHFTKLFPKKMIRLRMQRLASEVSRLEWIIDQVCCNSNFIVPKSIGCARAGKGDDIEHDAHNVCHEMPLGKLCYWYEI